MPSGGKRSAVAAAPPSRSSLLLHRPRSTTAPRSPVKRVSTKSFPTRFQGGDDSLSVVQDFDDVLAGGAISGQAISESQRRQPGIAKSMKTKAQSKAVGKKRKKEPTSDAPARAAKTGTNPLDEEVLLVAPIASGQATTTQDRALETRAIDTSSRSDEIQTSVDPPLEPSNVQDQAAHRATGLVRPSSPALAASVAHGTSVETPAPHGRSSLRRRILAPETPINSSRSDGLPHTPSRPRAGLQVESTGSKKARQSLPLAQSEDDLSAGINAGEGSREGSTSPRSPLAERLEESKLAVLPGERRRTGPTQGNGEPDLGKSAQDRSDSPPSASQSSLHCIVYCWHRDSQSSSQMQGQSFSQSHTQPQAFSASQQSQSHFLSQIQPLSQQSSVGATHDGERGVGFFEGMEEQPWVRVGVDQVVELMREQRDRTMLYRVAKGPPTRREVAHYCDWSADQPVE